MKIFTKYWCWAKKVQFLCACVYNDMFMNAFKSRISFCIIVLYGMLFCCCFSLYMPTNWVARSWVIELDENYGVTL